jgi:hypothetical protein
MPGPHLKGRDATIRQMAAEGHTVIDAAKTLGVGKDSLRNYARKHGVAFAPSPIGRPKKNQTEPSARDAKIASLCSDGMPLGEVAAIFGITRSRAQQIASSAGVSMRAIGLRRTIERKAAIDVARDMRCMWQWGVTHSELAAHRKAGVTAAYRRQRNNADRRGIAWLFTFATWLAVWRESGLLHMRGRRKGQYVMARFGDVGPYAPHNVCIKPAEENVSEAQTGRPRHAAMGAA